MAQIGQQTFGGDDLIVKSIGHMKALNLSLRDFQKTLPGGGKPDEAIRVAQNETPAQ